MKQSEITTGFKKIDSIINGLERKQITAVGGRPGMGKTSFALSVIENVSCRLKIPGVIFSTERSSKLIKENLVCSIAGIEPRHYKYGKPDESELKCVENAERTISESPVFIEDGLCDIGDIAEKISELSEKENIGLVVIDSLETIKDRTHKKDNSFKYICESIKNIADKFNVSVLLLFDNSVFNHDDAPPRPGQYDLRTAADRGGLYKGLINYAEKILIIYRKHYCFEPAEYNYTEIIISKKDSEDYDSVKVDFVKQGLRFVEINET